MGGGHLNNPSTKKSGFTLIELLAVIIILAVIALIATPIIMNAINNSKKGAAKDSGYAIIKAAEIEVGRGEFITPVTYNEKTDLNYKGTRPSKMILEIDKSGKTNMRAYIDGYCVSKNYTDSEVMIDDSLTSEVMCLSSINSNIIVDIKDGMIPVSYDVSGNTVKADISSRWYNYDIKKWANAVVVTSDSRDKYLKANSGTLIEESDILSYYVYIPRYKYLLWNAQGGVSNEQEIKIEFERRNVDKSNGNKNGEWLTHPAFTFGNSELNGIWVGKFEMTGTSSNPTIKPNQISLTSSTSSDQSMLGNFNTIKSMQSDSYGLTSYDSHTMKNMEWGAVTYLTNSKYGRCTDGTCTKTWINNVRVVVDTTVDADGNGPSITGCSGVNVNSFTKDGTTCESGRDYKQAGINASTTGNISGIYDMNGGAWERLMGVIVNSSGDVINAQGGFTASTLPDKKYYDTYQLPTNGFDFIKGKLGDATRETLKIANNNNGGWYSAFITMPNASNPWISRGARYTHNINSDIFSINCSTGKAWSYYGSRAVAVVE